MLTLIGGVAYSTTQAAWNDTVSVTSIQVNTGSVDLQVSPDGLSWTNGPLVTTASVSSLMPSATQTSVSANLFQLKNFSTGATFTIGAIIPTTGAHPLQIMRGATNVTATIDKTQLEIELFNVLTPTDRVLKTLDQWVLASQTFTGTIAPNSKEAFGMKVRLLPTAGDEWQNTTVTLAFDATGTMQ